MVNTQITAEPDSPNIEITREFNAPRDLVFKAMTDPELIVRWLGPRDLSMKIEEYDVRDGGRWRYVSIDPDGNEYRFHGVFHGTPSADLTTQTFEFEGVPDHVALEAMRLEEVDGKTVVRTVSTFQSVADRDGMVASGMESGVRQSDERLEELLVELG